MRNLHLTPVGGPIFKLSGILNSIKFIFSIKKSVMLVNVQCILPLKTVGCRESMLGRNLCKSSLTNTFFLYRGGHFVFGCFRKNRYFPVPDPLPSFPVRQKAIPLKGNLGCLPFERKIRLGCRKHNCKRFTSLP